MEVCHRKNSEINIAERSIFQRPFAKRTKNMAAKIWSLSPLHNQASNTAHFYVWNSMKF